MLKLEGLDTRPLQEEVVVGSLVQDPIRVETTSAKQSVLLVVQSQESALNTVA